MRPASLLAGFVFLWVAACGEHHEAATHQRVTTRLDMNARAALTGKIKQQGNPNDTNSLPILVSLEDFFEGNGDSGSIGPNLNPQPGPKKFYTVLQEVRRRKDVQDVLIRIRMVESEDMWPFSDTVYILTSAPTAEVASWLKALNPSEVYDNSVKHLTPDWPSRLAFPRDLRPGMRVVYAWWD